MNLKSFLKLPSCIILYFENGMCLNIGCENKVFSKLYNCTYLEEMDNAIKEEGLLDINLYNICDKSKILKKVDDHIVFSEVSDLSMPIDLVFKILGAEKTNNELLLETYKNFWTLLSLNTDELCRKNLYKFLSKWGMTISRCGFFLGYRNVDYKYNENTSIFTDRHSRTFTIKIGEIVTMDRSQCDCDSNISCSKGLSM